MECSYNIDRTLIGLGRNWEQNVIELLADLRNIDTFSKELHFKGRVTISCIGDCGADLTGPVACPAPIDDTARFSIPVKDLFLDNLSSEDIKGLRKARFNWDAQAAWRYHMNLIIAQNPGFLAAVIAAMQVKWDEWYAELVDIALLHCQCPDPILLSRPGSINVLQDFTERFEARNFKSKFY